MEILYGLDYEYGDPRAGSGSANVFFILILRAIINKVASNKIRNWGDPFDNQG